MRTPYRPGPGKSICVGAHRMTATSDSALVLFPGALGDACCFLPALAALRRTHAGRMCLVAQPGFLDLVTLADTTKVSMTRPAVADLFAAGPRLAAETTALFGGFGHVYSWTGFGNAEFARRLAQASGAAVQVHPFRGMRAGEHAADYYARCVGLPPLPVDPGIIDDARGWFTDFAARHRLRERGFLLMHPGSGARAKNWEGFGRVAQQWPRRQRAPVVVTLGPAEAEQPPAAIDAATVVDGLSLTQVAALLRRCRLYLGNDSGISHLAGIVGARGVVVFGPTDPTVWAPRSKQLQILHAPDACLRCAPERFCTHRLAAEPVLAALEHIAASVEA